ncbi:Myb/SANT-like DNA-binding domain 4 [Dillenia turbinata]|uniref:Myb/SANT-like DNA-binding domain 4 n=1 Tax=Dillenia turbinata TaxID=194707 RepID=A0AAN8VS07_9MAGN
MEPFPGERRRELTVSDEFPSNISPFPDPLPNSLLYDQSTAATALLPPPPHVLDPTSHLPPQKLRPIRCNNGRAMAAAAENNMGETNELGFLCPVPLKKLRTPHGGGVPVDFSAAAIAVAPELPDSDRMVGNGFEKVQQQAGLEKFGSGMFVDGTVLGRFSETDSSSSSDDDGNSADNADKHFRGKRKKKTSKRLEKFLENLIGQVINRQEQMHNQLIEMIEMKERERIIREEAWRQQEMERTKQEEKARAQETSRSLAIIAFIENWLGHEIQIPRSAETSCHDGEEGEIQNHSNMKFDPSSKRWPRSEVQALITLRSALDHKFRASGPKNTIWEEISIGMSSMGYSRSAKKCKEKWENINKYFKRSLESGKKRPENSKTCPYFHELDTLYKSGLVIAGQSSSSTNNQNEGKLAD